MNRPRSGSPIVVPIVIGLSILFLLVSLAAQSSPVQGPFSVVLSPIQSALSTVGRAIDNFFRPLGTVGVSQSDLSALQQQITALSAENVRLREFQAEVEQLRQLNKFTRDNPAIDFVGADVIGLGSRECENRDTVGPGVGVCAQVIAGDPSPYVRFVTINAGRRDGIETGMPVIGGGGVLIGRIGRNVSESTAQVQLLNDPASFINVQLVGSRASGTVAGQSDGSLRLQNVLQTETVQEGDLIITSGLGGGLPPGLAVGQVDKLISQDLETLKEASVRPGADFRRVEVVLVLKFKPPT